MALSKLEKKKRKWRWSDAKAMLFKDIVDKAVALNPTANDPTSKQIFQQRYKSRAEFQISDFSDEKKFATRLSRLRAQIRVKYERANEDAMALQHDRLIYPKPTHDP